MKRNRRIIRVVAIVLAVLLVGGVVFSALVSALAEAAYPVSDGPASDRYELSIEYLEDEQALWIEQRLVYINRTGEALDRVVFYAVPNMLRRESALMYESDDLEAVFSAGFAPGGIDLREVIVDGGAADYGFQGENELYLRVACELAPGERAVFEFKYYLLLTRGGAFVGIGDTDVRLSAFYFIPGMYDPVYHEFTVNKPLPFTRWLYADAADYEVTFSCATSKAYAVAPVGGVDHISTGREGMNWHIAAENVREFALSFGRRWREADRETASGTMLRLYTSARDVSRVLDIAETAVEQCEAWFGAFPTRDLVIAQSDYPLGALNFPGYIQMSSELFEKSNEEELKKQLRFCVAQQYFGLAAYVEPSADAWLSDGVSEYISYLLLEASEGHEAFLEAANRDWVSALQLTIPGGLTVTSDAALFDGYAYDIVVKTRGAVVMHELRGAMGLDAMLAGLAGFYGMGTATGKTLTEMDFVSCMDAASGYESGDRSWEAFLTDWVFNVGEYVNQSIDWFD